MKWSTDSCPAPDLSKGPFTELKVRWDKKLYSPLNPNSEITVSVPFLQYKSHAGKTVYFHVTAQPWPVSITIGTYFGGVTLAQIESARWKHNGGWWP